MDNFHKNFADYEKAANFLSGFFSIPDYWGNSCFRCPCSHRCKMNEDKYCEDVIEEWLREES